MRKSFEDKLKEFRTIKPDAAYSERSKLLIVSTPQQTPGTARFGSFFEIFRFAAVTAVAIMLVFSVLGGVSYVNKNYSLANLEGLDQNSLVAEAQDVQSSIDITMAEIKYLETTGKQARIKTARAASPAANAPALMMESLSEDQSIPQMSASSSSEAGTIDNLLDTLSQ